VVGIIAALASIPIFPLGILLGVVAVVLGVLGRKKAARREATNGGQATAGMVLGIVAIVVGALVGILLGSLIASNSEEISDLADCLSDASSTAEQDECRERFESEVGAG
jgi:amino acid transporter